MSDLKDKIDSLKLPNHIAIIMDGNGRWAKEHGRPRLFGHKNGVRAVREVTECCAELGVPYLTLYAFSTENWKRPKFEVNALMSLLVDTIGKEINTLQKNNIRLRAIGDLSALPDKTRSALEKGILDTEKNSRMNLILALNYSGRWEITQATKNIAEQVANGALKLTDIDTQLLESHLCTSAFPDPELLIRTSGEQRLSNFLLWQIAYAELYFTELKWPEFRKENMYQAILDYQYRERRFGMTGDQLSAI